MASQKSLIIDDSKTIRLQIREMLPKGNLEVPEAQNGVEGLELINQVIPTLVLLDFFLPCLNGWEPASPVVDLRSLLPLPRPLEDRSNLGVETTETTRSALAAGV